MKLWKKGHCPNEVAEANGTAAQNKQSGVRCSYWIDKQRTPCGGSHSWEDHKAALLKFGPPKGKGNPSDKGGKGKGKGKGKEQAHSLTEDPKEGQPAEDQFLEYLQASNWWMGESFSALTDARHSGQHASTCNSNTLESECCKRLAATSCGSGCCEKKGTVDAEGVSWAVPETTHWKLKQDSEEQ